MSAKKVAQEHRGSVEPSETLATNLFKLAFIRHRQRHEPIDPAQPPVIDPVENEAIAAIQQANHEGVYLAPYPPAGVAAR